MAKPTLRKMLGHADDPVINALMRVIETQSKTTLVNWCIRYAQEYFLPIYEETFPTDRRPRAALEASAGWLNKVLKPTDAKKITREAAAAAKEAEDYPQAQAAARAVSVAASVISTPTGALGMTFYGAAAIVYHRAGLLESPEVYDQLAEKEFSKMLASLQKAAVPDEPDPVKINWNC